MMRFPPAKASTKEITAGTSSTRTSVVVSGISAAAHHTKHSSKCAILGSKIYRGEVYMGCQGPCDQGRKTCPTPWACEIQIDDSPTGETPWREIKADLLLAIILCAASLGIAALIAGLI